ncbi:phospholipase D-like domain-containing protein [Geobacter argillaceus]|uniref:Phospholipase D-like protein n=1 Tax=Geobacter argillaceus TaxID=345631 RepID=A0A562VNY0_9BACT|nr:phospholipase D-like domain-containing protein [Geobacter argillaceus]TWJ19491.1 phospholipase D-like protein [Geobacter argillaceus]
MIGHGLKKCLALAIIVGLCVAGQAGPLSARENLPAQVTLLRNSDYAPALLDGIREAGKGIVVTMYLFKMTDSPGNLPRRIAEELVRARGRGVEVTVLLEQSDRPQDSLNDDNRATAQFLKRGGVKVFFDTPRVTTHVKAVVIDGRWVYLGSHNLTQSALRHNNELSLRIDSRELAAEITAFLDRI